MPSILGWLESVLAPRIERLEGKVDNYSTRSQRLSREIRENRQEIRDIWKEIGALKESNGKVDGRIKGLKEELTAKLRVEIQGLLIESLRKRALHGGTDG